MRYLPFLIYTLAALLFLQGCALFDALQENGEEENQPTENGETQCSEGEFAGEIRSIGESCGRCNEGILECNPDSEQELICRGERQESDLNACGGCSTLPASPGEECTEGSLTGIYACSADDTLFCQVASCDIDEIPPMMWPLSDEIPAVVTGYVDLSAGGQPLDYRDREGEAARLGLNPEALEITLPNYRFMDAPQAVRAPLDGIVISLEKGRFDRNLSCDPNSPPADNYVLLALENGFTLRLGSLRRDSILLEVGDEVAAGDLLGFAGGSGCTDRPKVELILRDCAGTALSTFANDLWSVAPPEPDRPRLLDLSVVQGTPESYFNVDPPPNQYSLNIQRPMTFHFTLSHMDSENINVILEERYEGFQNSTPFAAEILPSNSLVDGRVSLTNANGIFANYVEIEADGEILGSVDIESSESYARAQRLIREDLLSFLIDELANNPFGANYFPVDLEAFEMGGHTYYIIDFRSGGENQIRFLNRSSTAYESDVANVGLVHFNASVAVHPTPQGRRYSAFWYTESNDLFGRYESTSQAIHDSLVSTFAAEGLFPRKLYRYRVNDEWRHTALYHPFAWDEENEFEVDVPLTNLDGYLESRLIGENLAPLFISRQWDEDEEFGETKFTIVWTKVGNSAFPNFSVLVDRDLEFTLRRLSEGVLGASNLQAIAPYFNATGSLRFVLVYY